MSKKLGENKIAKTVQTKIAKGTINVQKSQGILKIANKN
jgi:hypothetical protein